MHQLLDWLALPQFGLSTVFLVSFISATLLPLVARLQLGGNDPCPCGSGKKYKKCCKPARGMSRRGGSRQ